MNLLHKFLKQFGVYLLLMSIVTSLVNSGILIFISSVIADDTISLFNDYNWLAFAGLIVFSLIMNYAFQSKLITLTNNLLYDFEDNVLKKLKRANYQYFEKLGKEKVYTAINDTRVLTNTPGTLIDAVNAVIRILCCLIYMCYVSFAGGAFVIAVIVFLFIIYIVQNTRLEKLLNIVREKQNDYYKYLHDLLEGFKEVSVDAKRSNNIFTKFLGRNLFERKELNTDTSIKYLNNELVGNHSWFLVIGVVLFGLPGLLDMEQSQTITFIVAILYIMGPVSIIIGIIPFYTRVKIALARLNEFDKTLQVENIKLDVDEAEQQFEHFDSLRFEDVTFEYFDNQVQQSFRLGPVSLTFTKGELVFITGGNGSGKSTFVMVLTGLYKPVSGKIYFNDEQVDLDNYRLYTNQISSIFTDNHLFSENYSDFNLSTDLEELNEYLEVLDLKEVLGVQDNHYSLNSKLSKGQQKRLALVLALLEDRPILVLDEWAAQQDVRHRAFFYKKLLPQLQKKGKTIIAVTHDDMYYTHADRIIKFDLGKVVSDQSAEDYEFQYTSKRNLQSIN